MNWHLCFWRRPAPPLLTTLPDIHGHRYELPVVEIERAEIDETDPVRHTAIHLLGCVCGSVIAFPEFNYGLTTLRFRVALAAALRTKGWRLEP